MLVVYDLRYASDHFAGIGTYEFSLLQELLELPGEERYRVLWSDTWPHTRYDFGPIQRTKSEPRVAACPVSKP